MVFGNNLSLCFEIGTLDIIYGSYLAVSRLFGNFKAEIILTGHLLGRQFHGWLVLLFFTE